MSEHLTPDQVRQNYITKMGKELGGQFNRIYNECAWLHLKWGDYVALFGTSQSRLGILNASAPGFFRLLNDSLWNDLLLHLCTLTDDPEVGRRKRQTLTIRRFSKLVDPAIQKNIKRLVSDAVKKCEFARDWRDRHIAHRDLRLALGEGATHLTPASRQNVIDAIRAIVAVLDAVEQHYCKTQTAYEHVSHLGDAVALLHVLRDGVEARDEQHRRLEFKAKPPI
jgi:HEPN superfamily AbiU2-like protein